MKGRVWKTEQTSKAWKEEDTSDDFVIPWRMIQPGGRLSPPLPASLYLDTSESAIETGRSCATGSEDRRLRAMGAAHPLHHLGAPARLARHHASETVHTSTTVTTSSEYLPTFN